MLCGRATLQTAVSAGVQFSIIMPTGLARVEVLAVRRASIEWLNMSAQSLRPQIGHKTGFQAPISTRSAWAPSAAHGACGLGWS